MAITTDESESIVRRLGVTWCALHHQALLFCVDPTCTQTALRQDAVGVDGVRDDQDNLSLHNWHTHDAIRKVAGWMSQGKTHPFRQAGGALTGFDEDDQTVEAAVRTAPTRVMSFKDVIATKQVDPQHVHLMLRGQAQEPQTGNHPLESVDTPTVVQCGHHMVIADGHHRLADAVARGQSKGKVRVVSGLTPRFTNGSSLLMEPE